MLHRVFSVTILFAPFNVNGSDLNVKCEKLNKSKH